MSFSSLLDNNKTTSSEATNIKANKTVFSSALDNKKDSSFSSSLTQNTDTALPSTAEQPKTDASFSLALHKPKKENFLTQTKLGYGLLGKATVGQLQFVEGLWDVTVGSIGSALGNKDMIDMSYGSNWTRDANKWLDDLYGMDSSDGGWNTYGDIMLGVGQQLPSIVANIASWGSASGVMALLQGLSAAGQSTSSAYETTGKAGLGEHVYGAIMGGADYGLEMITGGFGKLGKAVASSFGKTASKTALNAVAKQITAKAVAKGVIKEALGEAFEEGTEEFIDPYVQRITGVNPEAENATPEEIGYSAFVGGMSALLIGGAGGSVAMANNLRTGNKVVNENRIDTVIESNKQFAEYAKTKDSSIGALQTSLALREEYDKIKAKEGDKITQRQRYLLGEMETNNVMLATLPSIMQSKKNILNNAEKYAEAYNSMNYKNKDGSPYVISADEIRTNDNIATVLAVTDFANGLYKPFKGTEIYGDMDEVQYMNWQNSAPDEQIAEVSKYFGADMGKADYRYYTANKENASRKYGSESIYAKAHDIREFRPSDIKDNETGVYKAENGVILSIRKVDDNYTIVATDINGNGLGGTKQPVDYATIRKYVNRFSDLPSMKAETENTAKAEADRRTVLKHAQKTIEGFDLLSREIRTSILNSYIVGDRMNVDTESVDSYARVSAKLGIAITFADINTDGYYNYISAGKDMIYINPNGSRSLERVFTHEGYHSIYDTTEGQAIARMADAYYSTEEAKSRKEEIETRYREFASNPDNHFNLTPEIMREELSAHFIENILAEKDFIMQLGKEQPKGIKRLLSNVTDLMNYFKAKDKKAYQALLQLRKLYASGLVTNNTINSIMGDKKGDAVKNNLSAYTQINYSLPIGGEIVNARTVTENEVRTLLYNSLKKQYRDNSYIPIRVNTPSVILNSAESIGKKIEDNPVIMNVGKVRQMMLTQSQWIADGGNGRAHNFTTNDVIALIKAMDKPKLIIYQSADARYIEVVEFTTEMKQKAVAVLEVSEHKNVEYLNGFNGGLYQVLITAFEPDVGYVDSLLRKDGNIKIYPKKKGSSQRGSGNKAPSHLNESPFFDRISETSKNVNTFLEKNLKDDKKNIKKSSKNRFRPAVSVDQVKRDIKTLPGTTVNPVPFDRDTINNTAFADLVNEAIKEMEIREKQYQEGTSTRRRDNILGGKKRAYDREKLDRIRELGERKRQPETIEQQRELAQFLVDYGGTETIQYGLRNITVVKPEYMPTYQREVVNKFASTGRKANFFIGKAYRNGVLGWFSPSKGEVYIGMDNSANSIAIVNHENFHALRRNKNYFQATVDFMKSVRETAKKAGNDYKDIISTMKSSYPSLRNDPFNRGSQAIDVVMENSLLEEFCCELIAGDVKTDNKDLLRLREEFILNNQNVFFPDVDTDVLHVTDPAYNTAKDELRNTVSEIAETNVSRNTPVDNNVNPPIISNETTIEKVRGVMPVTEETRKERAKRTVTALQISLTNATAGIEKYLKSKGRANYEEVTNMARKARAKADFALTQGLYSFTDNSKLAKSYKEVFTWLETKYNRDTDKANYVKYKREFNDYMLHRHNVDRMNQFEDLSVSEIESLKISGETKKALTEYAQKNKLNSLTHETVLFVADNDVDIKEIEGFTRVIKPVFGKYLYFDTIAKQRIDDIKRDFPKFYDAIENAGTLSEADVYELLSAEMDTEKTATAKMITDYLVQVSAEDSKKRIAEIDQVHPEFSEHAQDVVDYSRGLLRLSWEAGNISYDTYQTLTKMYPNYVPTIRDTNGSIAVGGSAKTFSGSRVSQIVKRASGSDLVIMPIDNMLARRTEQIFSAWAINDVANALYETADNDAVRIVDEQRITKVPDIDYVTELVDPNRKDNKEFTLVFYRGGNLVSMSVRDDIYKGIYSLNDHNLKYNEIIQRVMYESMNFFKKSVTSYNPFFLIRNFLRDIQDATLYSKHGLGKIILNLPSAIKEMTADGSLWREYRMNGGLSSSVFDYTYGLKEFAEKGAVKRIYDKSLGRIVNPAVDFIERANVFTEQLTRFSEYMLARKNNLTIDSAMLQSDDVTVNFGRSGTLTKTANKFLFPFLNAKVQGFSKFFKTVVSRKTGKEIGSLLVRIGLLGLLPALINAIMYKDDEDYKDLAYYVKDNYYLFKIGDKFIKIPKGRILSLFGGGTTRTWDYLMNKDKEAYKGYVKEIWENLSPVDGVRSIFDPVSDVATNTSWYGSDIESQSMQNKYVKDRYDESTSAISIAIGQVTSYVGLSPAKVDYLLDQYSGVWGDIILPLTSKSAKTSFLTKDYLIDVAKSTKVVSAFYDCIEQETYAKNSGELASAGALKYLGSVKNDLNELYEQRKSISLSNLSQSDINGQTKTIQLLINTTAKTAVVNADEIKKLLANAKLTEDNYEEEYYKALRTVMGSEYAMLKYNKEAYYKMTSFKAVGINSDTYYDYYFNTKDITADVDKKGNTIGGSRKKKVLKYLATIKGLSTAQKILLIYASGFSVKDNEIKGLTKKKALSSVTAYLNKQKLTDVDREYFAKLFDLKIRNKRLVV